jgi:phosphoserine phosphatase RsbU/P
LLGNATIAPFNNPAKSIDERAAKTSLGHTDARLTNAPAARKVGSAGVLSERGEQILALMNPSVVRMSGLIDNLLDFARGRLGGGFTLTYRAEVDLEPILQQVVNELRIGAPGRTIETDFTLPDAVDCDPARFGQMVSNLLANGLTHGEPGEPVRLQAATTAAS